MSQSIPTLTPIENVNNVSADIRVDASGLYCPEPVMLLHKHFKELALNCVLELTATDPSTTRDVPMRLFISFRPISLPTVQR